MIVLSGRAKVALVATAAVLAPGAVAAYPGGTPQYQTDVAPFCASCHSSITEDALAGAGEYAQKQLVQNKHIAPILAGQGAFAELPEEQRVALVEHIRAMDANSSIAIEFPPQVTAGERFTVTVNLTGGAGPAVGLALVDRPHRWFARPASSAGWTVLGAPTIIGPDGKPQTEWVQHRPEEMGPGITFVNVTGVESDPVAGSYAKAKVIFTLKAPQAPGNYPLVGAYFYGTEKASPYGFKLTPVGYKLPRGGYAGGSGRVAFSPQHTITVKAPAAGE